MEPAERPTPDVVIVVAGGELVDRSIVTRLPQAVPVFAADSGLENAESIGLRPDVVVGDMDSVNPMALAAAEKAGAKVIRHPVAKDATDLELALRHAHTEGFRRTVLIGGAGGRISHLLGNAAVITSPAFADMAIVWHVAASTVQVVRPEISATVEGASGDLVSLVAVGGSAAGVSTEGLRWRLADATLEPGSTRGISNEMTGTVAKVTLGHGVLLAIHERTHP